LQAAEYFCKHGNFAGFELDFMDNRFPMATNAKVLAGCVCGLRAHPKKKMADDLRLAPQLGYMYPYDAAVKDYANAFVKEVKTAAAAMVKRVDAAKSSIATKNSRVGLIGEMNALKAATSKTSSQGGSSWTRGNDIQRDLNFKNQTQWKEWGKGNAKNEEKEDASAIASAEAAAIDGLVATFANARQGVQILELSDEGELSEEGDEDDDGPSSQPASGASVPPPGADPFGWQSQPPVELPVQGRGEGGQPQQQSGLNPEAEAENVLTE
jgi:hypothetical protein